MLFLIASDKFKGSLTSMEVGEAVKAGLLARWPGAKVMIFPMADGGDGFDDVMEYYYPLDKVSSETVDPLHRRIKATWRRDAANNTAYISVAAASGLVLLKEAERNPELTSTYGTGLLIREAIESGAEKIVLGLGGSATNDAGMGILAALGFDLLDKQGKKLQPVGKNLIRIQRIERPGTSLNVEFDIACDVENPLYGTNGAAFVYGPQKGADAAMVQRLDDGLRSVAHLLSTVNGSELGSVAGLGAAGGIAAGLLPFFPVKIRPGIDWVLEASGIEQQFPSADIIITGEGKLDSQSLQGKVVGRIAELAGRYQKKCIAVCGINELEEQAAKNLGLEKIIAIRDHAKSDKEAMEEAAKLLQKAIGKM